MASLVFSLTSFLLLHYYEFMRKLGKRDSFDQMPPHPFKHSDRKGESIHIESGPLIPERRGADPDEYTEEEEKAKNTYKDMYQDTDDSDTDDYDEDEEDMDKDENDEADDGLGVQDHGMDHGRMVLPDEEEVQAAKLAFDRLIIDPVTEPDAPGK